MLKGITVLICAAIVVLFVVLPSCDNEKKDSSTGSDTKAKPALPLLKPKEAPKTPQRKIELVSDGKSEYSIIGDPESICVKELQSYIEKMSCAKLPVLPLSNSPMPEKAIVVGDISGAAAEKPALGPQEYRLKIDAKRLLIIGGGPDGVSNGVYGLLDDHWGCRFLTVKEDFVPVSPTLSLPEDLNEKKAPSIRDRQWILTGGLMDNKDWRRRNRMTFEMQGYACHNLFQLLPPDKYFKDHPDWYPLGKDALRKNKFEWLCWTNQEMLKELTRVIKEKMSKTPANQYIPVGQGDGFESPCNCPQCRALVEKYGSEIAPIIQGLNQVLNETSKEFPKHEIVAFAYYATLVPPVKGDEKLVPHPNLCLTFVRTGDGMKNIEFASNRKALLDHFLVWRTLTGNLQVWSWSVGFKNSLCPFPNYKAMAEDTKCYAKNGLRGLMHQMYGNGEWYVLRQWLLARIMWDASLDVEETEKDFLRSYYGEDAAKPLWSIIDKMQKAAEKTDKTFNAVFGSDPKYVRENLFPPEGMEFYRKAFDEAIAAAEKSGSPAFAERVKDTMARSFSMLLFSEPKPMQRVTIDGKDWMLPDGDAGLALSTVRLAEILKKTIMWEWYGPELGRRKFMNNAGGPMELVENEKLKLGFCPALDGTLCSLIDKENNAELLRIGPPGKAEESGIRHMIFSSSAAEHTVNIENEDKLTRVTLSGPPITWTWMCFPAFRHDRVFELPKNRSGFSVKSYIYADSKNPAFGLYGVYKDPSMKNVLDKPIYDPHVTMRFAASQPKDFKMLAISPKGAQLYQFDNSKTCQISLPAQRASEEMLTLYFSGVVPEKMLAISTLWKEWDKITVELNPDTESFLLKFDGPKLECKKDIKTLYGSFDIDILPKEELQRQMPVEKLCVKTGETNKPVLEWEPKNFKGFSGYHVYASKGQGAFKRLTDKPLTNSSWSPKRAMANDRWRFWVSVVDVNGKEGVYSPFVCWRNIKDAEYASILLVANNGTGDFMTLQDAFDALPRTEWKQDQTLQVLDTSSEFPDGYDGAQLPDECIQAAKGKVLHLLGLKGKPRIRGTIDLNGKGKLEQNVQRITAEIRSFRFVAPAVLGIEAPGPDSIIAENEFIEIKNGIAFQWYSSNPGTIIERNFFYKNGNSIYGIGVGGGTEKQPLLIRNNIFASAQVYTSGTWVYVVNNTFDSCSIVVWANANFTIANNMFAYKTALNMVSARESYVACKQVIDGNIFHQCIPLLNFEGKSRELSLADAVKNAGLGTANREAVPLWLAIESAPAKALENQPQLETEHQVGGGAEYYKLCPESPCLKGGIKGLPSGDVDFFGNKRKIDDPGVGAACAAMK